MLPSRRDLFAVGRRSLNISPTPRINPSVADIKGSDLNLVLGSQSLMGEEIVASLASCMLGLWVETATGAALDRVAFDRYGLTRFPATPARIDLLLFRSAPGAGGTYSAGSRVQTTEGTQFSLDVDAVFAPSGLSRAVTGTALVAGPGGNAAVNAVTQFTDQSFAPNLLQVTNPTSAAGGADAESDAAFRGRIRDFFPTVRRATLGAIEFGALQVPGVSVARATEITNINGFPAAFVQLVIADANGTSTGALNTAVANSLLEFRALGIPVEVLGGVLLTPSPLIQWRVAFEAGIDQSVAAAQIRAVTVASASNLGPGEPLYRSALFAAARTVNGAIISDSSLLQPIGDIVPTDPNTIIRLNEQDVTFV